MVVNQDRRQKPSGCYPTSIGCRFLKHDTDDCSQRGVEMKEGPTMLMKTKDRFRMVPLY